MALLYCRHGNVGTAEYKFRVNCACRIQDLTSIEKHATLPPLPLITYAVSMSLAVAYQARHDKQINAREADKDLKARFKSLETLSKNDWKARQMARLAKRVVPSLNETDHVDEGSIECSYLPTSNSSQYSSSVIDTTATANASNLLSPGGQVQRDLANQIHTTSEFPGETLHDDIQFEIPFDDTEFQFSEFDQYMTGVFTLGEHLVPVRNESYKRGYPVENIASHAYMRPPEFV